jgi:hypothetical protein
MQGLRGELYLYAKPALEMGSYFHVLALFKTFRKKGVTYTNHTRVANN